MSLPVRRAQTATRHRSQQTASDPQNTLVLEQELLQQLGRLQKATKTNPAGVWLQKYRVAELMQSERIKTRRIAAMANYLYQKRIPIDWSQRKHAVVQFDQRMPPQVAERCYEIIEQLGAADGSLVFFEKGKFTPMINKEAEMEDAAKSLDFRFVPDPKDYYSFMVRRAVAKEVKTGFFLARQKEATSPIARIQSAGWGGWYNPTSNQNKDPKAPSSIFLFSHPHDRKDYNLDYSINVMFLNSLPRFLHTDQPLKTNRAKTPTGTQSTAPNMRVYPTENAKLASKRPQPQYMDLLANTNAGADNQKSNRSRVAANPSAKYNPDLSADEPQEKSRHIELPGLFNLTSDLENSRISMSNLGEQSRRNRRNSAKFEGATSSFKHIQEEIGANQSKPTSGPIGGLLNKPMPPGIKSPSSLQRRSSNSIPSNQQSPYPPSIFSRNDLGYSEAKSYQDLPIGQPIKRSYLNLPDDDLQNRDAQHAVPITQQSTSLKMIGSRRNIPSQPHSAAEGIPGDLLHKKHGGDVNHQLHTIAEIRNRSHLSDGQDPSMKRIPSKEINGGDVNSGRNITDTEFPDNSKPVLQETRTLKDFAIKMVGPQGKKGARNFKELIIECMDGANKDGDSTVERQPPQLTVTLPDVSKLSAGEALKLLVQVNNKITEKYGDGQTSYTRYATRGMISDGSQTIPGSQSNYNNQGFPSPSPYEDKMHLDDIEELEPVADRLLGRDDGSSVKSHISRKNRQENDLELLEEKELSIGAEPYRKSSGIKEGSRVQGTPDHSGHRPSSGRRTGKSIQTMNHGQAKDFAQRRQGQGRSTQSRSPNEVPFRLRAVTDMKIKIDKSQEDLSFEQHPDLSNMINDSFAISTIKMDMSKSNMSVSPGGNLFVQPLKNPMAAKREKFQQTSKSKASYYSSVKDPRLMKNYLRELAEPVHH